MKSDECSVDFLPGVIVTISTARYDFSLISLSVDFSISEALNISLLPKYTALNVGGAHDTGTATNGTAITSQVDGYFR